MSFHYRDLKSKGMGGVKTFTVMGLDDYTKYFLEIPSSLHEFPKDGVLPVIYLP